MVMMTSCNVYHRNGDCNSDNVISMSHLTCHTWTSCDNRFKTFFLRSSNSASSSLANKTQTWIYIRLNQCMQMYPILIPKVIISMSFTNKCSVYVRKLHSPFSQSSINDYQTATMTQTSTSANLLHVERGEISHLCWITILPHRMFKLASLFTREGIPSGWARSQRGLYVTEHWVLELFSLFLRNWRGVEGVSQWRWGGVGCGDNDEKALALRWR